LLVEVRFDELLFPSLLSGDLFLLKPGNLKKDFSFNEVMWYIYRRGITQVRRSPRWSSSPLPSLHRFSLLEYDASYLPLKLNDQTMTDQDI